MGRGRVRVGVGAVRVRVRVGAVGYLRIMEWCPMPATLSCIPAHKRLPVPLPPSPDSK